MTALFGSIIFVVNVFLPTPVNYLLIVVQAVLLAISGLFIPRVGAISAGALGGLLTALLGPAFGPPALGPFTFFFSFLFGVFVDLSFLLFRIRGSMEGINRNKTIAAMALSTLLIAVSSYSAFAAFPNYVNLAGFSFVSLIIQQSPMLDMLVLFMGSASGAVAGYAASYLWNKYLKAISF
jgi:hypothetical protein